MKRSFGRLIAMLSLASLFVFSIVPAFSQDANSGADIPAAAAYSDSADTQSLIYYLFLPACKSCLNAEAVIGQLPARVTVTKDGATFESSLMVKAIDLSKEPVLAKLLFERYQVPPENQYAPIVFLGSTYCLGAAAIEADMKNAIMAGQALNTPVLWGDAGKADLSALTWAGTIGAGLIGGLNPCALSMLLLFLMVLANTGRSSGRYAAAFLGAKFLTYLLLGTALLGVFQLWNPTWLPLAIRWLLTGLGAVVIGLNLWDAWAAKQERYGSIRNQLPGKWRGFLHEKIQALSSTKHLMLVALLLGAFVASGEFLCAGQLYLDMLLAALQSGADTQRLLPMLTLYCLCFLTPSILLSTAMVRGKAAFSLSESIRAKMPLIKMLSAAVMLLILIFIWL